MVEVACRLLGVGGFRRVEQSPNAQKLLGDLCSSAKVEPLECASPVQYRASRLPERARRLAASDVASDRLFE